MEKHKKAIFEILSQLIEPKLKWTIGVLNLIKRLEINDQVLELEIQ